MKQTSTQTKPATAVTPITHVLEQQEIFYRQQLNEKDKRIEALGI